MKHNMYFLAAQTFQDSLTHQLGLNDERLAAALNVKIDFRLLAAESKKLYLCNQAFSYLGLVESLDL